MTSPSANNWYVRSSANGAGDGSDWADAYPTISTALNASNTFAGDAIWVSDDHVEISVPSSITPITYIQGAAGSGGSANNTTVSLSQPVGNGNMLCVSAGSVNATNNGVVSVTDDMGNAYTLLDHIDTNTSGTLQSAYLLNVTNAPSNITVHWSSIVSLSTITVDEFSGVATATALDGHNILFSNLGGNNSSTSNTFTTTAAGDLVYGATGDFFNTGGTLANGTGFTAAQINAGGGPLHMSTEYQIKAAAGSTAATFSPTSNSNFITAGMAFKAKVVTPTGLILTTNNQSVTTPTYILCANHTSGNVPPNITTDLRTTANVISRDLALTVSNGAMTFYGINFNAALGNTNGYGAINITPSMQSFQRYLNCTFNQFGNNYANGPALTLGGGSVSSSKHTFNNCSFLMTKPLHRVVFNGGETDFINSKFVSTTSLTSVLYQSNAAGAYSRARFKRCDLSGITALYLYDAGQISPQMYDIAFDECILGSNITNFIENSATNIGAAPLQTTRTNGTFNSVYLDYWVQSQMSTITRRIGGAFDPASDSSFSIQMETWPDANTSPMFPATVNPIVKWNTDTSDVLTASVYGNWSNSTGLPTNAQLWIEVEYLANSNPANNMTSISSSGCNGNNPIIYPWNVTAANTVAHDTTSTWFAGTANSSFVLQTTFKAGQEGPIKVWIKNGTSPNDFNFAFIDPVVYISNSSGGYVSKSAITSNTSLVYTTSLATINESKKGHTEPMMTNVWIIS